MKLLKFILKLSRPRFWLYLGGTYLVGYAVGITNYHEFLRPTFWVHFLFFLIPANVFLYGINDYYDEDTDQFNTKKQTHEQLLVSKDKKKLKIILWICAGLFALLMLWQPTNLARILLLALLFLSYAYSASPFRFKAKPFIDFLSNILYGLPGILAYIQLTHHLPSPEVIIAIWCWTSAMHLFSAIPDIVSDRMANLKTTAVVLGHRNSLLLCAMLWSMMSGIVIAQKWLGGFGLLSLVYPLIPLSLLLTKKEMTEKVYWWFPYMNAAIGGVLFFIVILNK